MGGNETNAITILFKIKEGVNFRTMAKKKIKVMVLMGGPSAEHEVSLAGGKEILKHLDPKKYIAERVMITKKGEWLLPDAPLAKIADAPSQSHALVRRRAMPRDDIKADIVFIALHGKYGEDGTVQGFLDALDMPYTGSGVRASALGMDKPRTLSIFRDAGLLVPDFQVAVRSEFTRDGEKIFRDAVRRFSLPLVVKPADHGSSIGVTIVKRKSDLPRAAAEALRHSDEIMLQKFIRGREITCGVLEQKDGALLSLPPIEILPQKGEFYDYASKYADGGSDHVIPPPGVSGKKIKEMQEAAAKAHRLIGCRGMSRTDFIMDAKGDLYVLEINTIPGMTPTSLLPHAAAALGISFPKLLDMLIASALKKL